MGLRTMEKHTLKSPEGYEHLRALALRLAGKFEENQLNNPDRLAVFERIFGVKGRECVANHPRFHGLIRDVATLALSLFLEDIDIKTTAGRVAKAHFAMGVTAAQFVQGCFEILDFVEQEAPGFYRVFQKNIRKLILKTTEITEELVQEK
jgi:hypothetical protein